MAETLRSIRERPRGTVPPMDSFGGLLDDPRARGAFSLRTVMTPPWALRILAESPITVLAMIRGHAWVLPDDGEPVRLDVGAVLEQRGGLAVEAQDAAEHAPVARAQGVPLLRQKAGELGPAAVLDAGAVDPRAEAHVAGAVLDAELLHERAEARVRALVEDDEARVDCNGDTVDVDVHCRRVPADPVTRLVERDRVAGGVEPPGGHHPGDARPDACAAHQQPGWMRVAFSARSGTGRMSHTRPKTDRRRRT